MVLNKYSLANQIGYIRGQKRIIIRETSVMDKYAKWLYGKTIGRKMDSWTHG